MTKSHRESVINDMLKIAERITEIVEEMGKRKREMLKGEKS